MEILKELKPEGIRSMDERALEAFVNDLYRFYWKHYHSARSLKHYLSKWLQDNNC